jgi:hypothetical protein
MGLGKPPDRQTLIFLEDGSNIADKCLFPHPDTVILLLLISSGLPLLYDLVDDLNQSFLQPPVTLLSPNCFLNFFEALTGSYNQSKKVTYE